MKNAWNRIMTDNAKLLRGRSLQKAFFVLLLIEQCYDYEMLKSLQLHCINFSICR